MRSIETVLIYNRSNLVERIWISREAKMGPLNFCPSLGWVLFLASRLASTVNVALINLYLTAIVRVAQNWTFVWTGHEIVPTSLLESAGPERNRHHSERIQDVRIVRHRWRHIIRDRHRSHCLSRFARAGVGNFGWVVLLRVCPSRDFSL